MGSVIFKIFRFHLRPQCNLIGTYGFLSVGYKGAFNQEGGGEKACAELPVATHFFSPGMCLYILLV